MCGACCPRLVSLALVGLVVCARGACLRAGAAGGSACVWGARFVLSCPSHLVSPCVMSLMCAACRVLGLARAGLVLRGLWLVRGSSPWVPASCVVAVVHCMLLSG